MMLTSDVCKHMYFESKNVCVKITFILFYYQNDYVYGR